MAAELLVAARVGAAEVDEEVVAVSGKRSETEAPTLAGPAARMRDGAAVVVGDPGLELGAGAVEGHDSSRALGEGLVGPQVDPLGRRDGNLQVAALAESAQSAISSSALTTEP